jgi:outer membrane receptor for ferrienterochelin and colicins
LDAYRTDFIQQTVVDLDRSPYEIHFSNLHGASYSNSLQAQVKQEIVNDLVVIVAAKYNDARTTYNGTLMQKPFSPTWRSLTNVSYTFWKDRIKLDATAQFVGEQRVPDLSGKISTNDLVAHSPSFEKLLGQVTYQTKRWEAYVGGENLTNYTQDNPIIGASEPFGPNFDAAMIWGPVTGPMLYAGFRFKILNK